MLESMAKQFERPKGFMGKVAGLIMFFENRKINHWTISQLGLEKGDRILEVGYGPGYAIRSIMKQNRQVFLDGVDLSRDMKTEATKRNQPFIEMGRIQLYTGDVYDFRPRHKYNKVFSVNNYPLWERPVQSLKHLYEMLEDGGRIVLTVQPREEGSVDQTAVLLGKKISQDLYIAGFKDIVQGFKKVRPVLTVSVSAQKNKPA
ncbi:class I SAM-dependent methyltransferase [Bacillus sp. T33-2]|uniref:class I SAM-dependent methyltransferase n=1 Tax=Bacillus sp. T33-2 TaxID=2054168 RepID=UPI000C78FF33|nr:methyltransferase domain-containing protein [Bacillus sp. T33-2]PLR98810.1 class I SAM-dependent methyltransferase [Bacillus sp. T33-2]